MAQTIHRRYTGAGMGRRDERQRINRWMGRRDTSNGASAYIADALANSVTVLNTATNQVVTTLSVGFLPVKTAITPNGATAYVADAGAN
jgi:YVTN family beta-propeller protein